MTNEDGRIDLLRALRIGHDEIVQLRRRLDVVEPKAEAYDVIRTIVQNIPGKPVGMAEDAAWLLRREVEKIEEARKQDPSRD